MGEFLWSHLLKRLFISNPHTMPPILVSFLKQEEHGLYLRLLLFSLMLWIHSYEKIIRMFRLKRANDFSCVSIPKFLHVCGEVCRPGILGTGLCSCYVSCMFTAEPWMKFLVVRDAEHSWVQLTEQRGSDVTFLFCNSCLKYFRTFGNLLSVLLCTIRWTLYTVRWEQKLLWIQVYWV